MSMTPAIAEITVSQLIAKYVEDYLPMKAPTTQYQQGRLFLWIEQQLGSLLLQELTPERLRLWKAGLLLRYKPGTVRRYMDTLSAALTVAVSDYDWLAGNPLRKVRKPPEPKGRTRFLSVPERKRLLDACALSRNPTLTPVVMMALTTGARKGEILGLRWGEVDLDRSVIRLLDTKNGSSRGVPMPSMTCALLRDWMCKRRYDVDFLFPRFDGKAPVYIDRAWEKAVERAELVDFHFHDLRHTAASYLAMSGASQRDIAEILGHKSLAMTFRYSHLLEAHTGAVVQRMADMFLG